MSDQADAANAAEDPAAGGRTHAEGVQMTELERIRHSAAHILATAILRIWPDAQFAAGPPVDNGFYYDLDLPDGHRITPEDFASIEAEMKRETKANHVFERVVVSRDEALAMAERGALASLGERPGQPSRFKLDIVQNIPAGETITLFRNGEFTDLCAGPHVGRTGNVGAFRLTHVAATYYKGDEKNPQLQRVYGTAFKNRTQLDEYFARLEEAKKRDHRKLGKELQLFTFDDDVGPGLAMWLPRGTAIIEELEKLAKETEFAAGYERVRTPHIARANIYLTSGHLPLYEDSMFPPMILDEGESAPGSARAPRAPSGASPDGPPPAVGDSGGAPEPAREARALPGDTFYSKRRLPHFERPWGKYAVTFSTHDRRELTPAERDIVLKSILYAHEHHQYELYVACVMPDHVHLLFEPQIKGRDEQGKPVFWPLTEILQAIKSSTAHRINRERGEQGAVWVRESFDRLIRSESDLEEKFGYICQNPWAAGIVQGSEDYPWLWTPDGSPGSARAPHALAGAPAGQPSSPTETGPSGGAPDGARGARALPGSEASAVPKAIGDKYYLKPMNCPHHHKLFGAVPRSYRDLPLRFAEYGTCYRYEQSGELLGLMRVRSMQMNDAHIYCTKAQFETEFNAVNEMYLKYFKIFGIEKYVMRFSTHDPARLGEKYVNEPELWKETEDMVRAVLVNSGIPYVEVPNEGAFYGPKIDVQVYNVIGREFTLATNQVDFAVPKRFGLVYKTRENTEETPLCIHRAPLGTHERFIGFLIEHYAGNFPLWLAPEQVRVLPLLSGKDEEQDRLLLHYVKGIHHELRHEGVRATLDDSVDHIKAKIARAEEMKVHTMLVVGARDLDAGVVSVRVHGQGNVGAKPHREVLADILQAIKERRP